MTVHVVGVEEFEQLADRVTELEHRLAAAAKPWPQWMSLDTAARYLDVSPERLSKLKQRGRIPYHQEGPGHRVLFNRHDLDTWMLTLRRGGDAKTIAPGA